jgi:hypothetical protein
MMRRVKPKLTPQLIVDAVFFGMLGIFYVTFRQVLPPMLPKLNELFVASCAALGLNLLCFYLILGINHKAAFFLHIVLFPVISLFYAFLKWMPSVIEGALYGASPEVFSALMLVHVILLAGYFIAQFTLWLAKRTSGFY